MTGRQVSQHINAKRRMVKKYLWGRRVAMCVLVSNHMACLCSWGEQTFELGNGAETA